MTQNTIKVIFSNKSSSKRIPAGTKMLIRRACTAVLRLENYEGDAAIGVTFMTQFRLNAIPRAGLCGHDEPFRIAPADGMLGRLYIAPEETSRTAVLHNRSQQTELVYMTVKATLLLLGCCERAELDGKIEWIMHCFGMPITTKYAVMQYA